LWTEPGSDGQIFAFAKVSLFYKVASLASSPIPDDVWSDPIPGIGGSMLVAKEKSGLRSNDEAFKMATTDALSVALKMIGVAADIYAGLWDGTKYKEGEAKPISQDQVIQIMDLLDETKSDEVKFLKYVKAKTVQSMTTDQYDFAIKALEGKKK
jgi:hypothetical protein